MFTWFWDGKDWVPRRAPIVNSIPDIPKQKDSKGKFIEGTGSEAFHIGLVNSAGYGGDDFTSLEIAESAGSPSIYGGLGVNVRAGNIVSTG
jgi:hypothetical protein